MRARMQSMRAAMERGIESILTPEQLETLRAVQDKAAGQRRASVWLLGDDGEPEERRIVVGLHDDEATEVVSGLEEGRRGDRARHVRGELMAFLRCHDVHKDYTVGTETVRALDGVSLMPSTAASSYP